MKIDGTVIKNKSLWIVEIPILDLMTQGKTKDDALNMASSAVKDLVNKEKFKVITISSSGNRICLVSRDTNTLASLILRRQREKNGLSISDVASRLGFSSRNSYARYETSSTKIGFDKFLSLYSAVSGTELTIR